MCRRLIALLALALSLLILTVAARAQEPPGKSKFEDSNEWKKDTKDLRKSLVAGTTTADPNDASHKLAVELIAKYLVYGVHWAADGNPTPGAINKAVREFSDQLERLSLEKTREKLAPFQNMLVGSSIKLCKEVISTSKPIVAVNTAMLMSRIPARRIGSRGMVSEKEWVEEVTPRLINGNADTLVSTCIELLEGERSKEEKGKANNGLRYYLFRTIESTLAIPSPKDPLVKPATQEKAIQLALDFIANGPKFTKVTPREEIEGYKALRREALKVVARSRTATIGAKGQPGLVLARFAANDSSITPPPRLDERMDAAVGMCRLINQVKASPNFQPDYAASTVGLAVSAFGVAANRNIENKKDTERLRPWQADAARLIEAIDLMKANNKNKYVADIAAKCSDVLGPAESGKQSGTAPGDLVEWIKSNLPESKSLFRGVDDAVVKPAEEKTGD